MKFALGPILVKQLLKIVASLSLIPPKRDPFKKCGAFKKYNVFKKRDVCKKYDACKKCNAF